MKCLNLGCGSRFLEDWTNVDFATSSPKVIVHNLTKGVPFEDASFDVVYHSHVLEHFDAKTGYFFLNECQRVLKKDGTLRIVVPDLEQIAKNYLNSVNAGIENASDSTISRKHQWFALELLDQIGRNWEGGNVAQFWIACNADDSSLLEARCGDEFKEFRRKYTVNVQHPNRLKRAYYNWLYANKAKFIKKYSTHFLLKHLVYYMVGKFRIGKGEIHLQMYDRYLLNRVLTEIGFVDFKIVSAESSTIQNWNKYSSLDIEQGKVRKPDSIFIEVKKR